VQICNRHAVLEGHGHGRDSDSSWNSSSSILFREKLALVAGLTFVQWDVSALFKIPDEIPSEVAGPLFCAGATVWGPLYEHGFKAGDRIAILGIGGLGHLAIQMVSKMGMEAVVFSGTESKREEAMQFGAREFYATKGVTKFEGVEKVDGLLITTSVLPDMSLLVKTELLSLTPLTLARYLPMLAPHAKIFPLTVSMDSLPAPVLPFIMGGLSIIGSGGAHPNSIHAMLRFCAKSDIKPVIEKFPMTQKGVTEAMTRLAAGTIRYRGVLVV
jgi:D-arabinose 1-dehydrogenase-like Zn-dependent alcohol dehydrogenase